MTKQRNLFLLGLCAVSGIWTETVQAKEKWIHVRNMGGQDSRRGDDELINFPGITYVEIAGVLPEDQEKIRFSLSQNVPWSLFSSGSDRNILSNLQHGSSFNGNLAKYGNSLYLSSFKCGSESDGELFRRYPNGFMIRLSDSKVALANGTVNQNGLTAIKWQESIRSVQWQNKSKGSGKANAASKQKSKNKLHKSKSRK